MKIINKTASPDDTRRRDVLLEIDIINQRIVHLKNQADTQNALEWHYKKLQERQALLARL